MINKEEFEKCSVKEKLDFIKKVLRLATHNAFTKDDLLLLIKTQNEIIENMKCCQNCLNETENENEEPCYSCHSRSNWKPADED
jgi:hypothetical protein